MKFCQDTIQLRGGQARLPVPGEDPDTDAILPPLAMNEGLFKDEAKTSGWEFVELKDRDYLGQGTPGVVVASLRYCAAVLDNDRLPGNTDGQGEQTSHRFVRRHPLGKMILAHLRCFRLVRTSTA